MSKTLLTSWVTRLANGVKTNTYAISHAKACYYGDPDNNIMVSDILDKTNYLQLTGTLTAGQTSLSINNPAIKSTSLIENIYSNKFDVKPLNISVVNGSITLTFKKQDVNVDVIIRLQ